MGRKRRAARETTRQDVLPVQYNKTDFEQREKTVIDYTEAIRSHNRNINQRELSKDDVSEQFTLAVLEEYATTEPKCFELLDQVSYNQIRVIDSKLD